MPNTKSAETRARNSVRRAAINRRSKSRLKSLERRLSDAIKSGKADETAKALREVSSAFDKAAKTGVVHRGKADRKKSRLALSVKRATAPKKA
ncbi:MAG: 30S ribosomal protein S20 [Verrucomicrobia bacterium]|nr:30S ribosomal protein S20 [Verrucomicrobiota bacterium]MBI3870867.1 30S ribosomal protein S20 [Verrucomicrobiota bacterium]